MVFLQAHDGRQDIVQCVHRFCEEVASESLSVDGITQNKLASKLQGGLYWLLSSTQ